MLDDNPEYQLARAEYLFPDADSPDMKMALRIRAAQQMYDIEARYETA